LSDIPYARPSSTVVLVRAGTGEPELFMVRRHADSSFGAAYAFPGGVIDPEDKAVHAHCGGLTAREADARLGTSGEGLDYYSAAIRELFEETGVLLSDVDRVAEGPDAARDALNDGSDNWADFVKRNKLQLECGELHYFALTGSRRQRRSGGTRRGSLLRRCRMASTPATVAAS
jgi:8-oxo-dGTP pyrophosphatase MutT (NUDIX family)